jgi:hypothetical protein
LSPATAERAGFLAVHKGAIEIRFGADDKRIELKIRANRGAGEEPGDVEITRRPAGIARIGPVAGAEAVTQIEAEIDPALL